MRPGCWEPLFKLQKWFAEPNDNSNLLNPSFCTDEDIEYRDIHVDVQGIEFVLNIDFIRFWMNLVIFGH